MTSGPGSSPQQAGPAAWLGEGASLLGHAALYFAVARLALAVAVVHGSVSSIWPPTGYALALLWLHGRRHWASILVGAVAVNAMNGSSAPVALAVGVGNTLEALVGVTLLAQAGFNQKLERLRDVVAFVVLGAGLAPAASALTGVTALWLGGEVPGRLYAHVLATWWLGNAMGALIVAPLLFTLPSTLIGRADRRRFAEGLALAAASLLTGALLFFGKHVHQDLPLGFLVFPLAVWAALRLGAPGAAVASASLAAMAVLGTVNGRGPFARPDLALALTLVQGFLSVVTISALSLAAAVAEERRGRERLAESEDRFRKVVDGAFDALVLHDGEGRIHDVNRRATESLGYTRADFLALRVFALSAARTEAELRALWAGVSPQRSIMVEGLVRRKDGGVLPVEVSVGAIETPEGRLYVSLIRDNTERHRAEHDRAALAEQLRQAQKMEAVGTLAGGVAHDFNNLLTGILGNLELTGERLPDGDPGHKYLDRATRAADVAARMVSQLLTFSRRKPAQSGEPSTDVNTAISQAIELLSRVIDPRIHVDLRLEPALGEARIGLEELQQVLINLGVNARDAMPGGGRLVFATHRRRLDAGALRNPEATPGTYLFVEVEDSGEGMSKEVLDRAFEPFFTTKEVGRGTGLGLAVCWGIAQRAGGWIEVDSVPGRGTRVEIVLPAARSSGPVVPPPEEGEVPGGTERVLVVDDNEHAREVARTLLQRRGYRVEEAIDGLDAVEQVEERGAPDLVVLDLTMPRLSGRETLARLLAMHPRILVVVSSGYSVDGGEDEVRSWGAAAFVGKPYKRDQLLRAVRKTLDEGLVTEP